MPQVISITHFTDPGCPWAWSASPALAALQWRYGDQLDWRHVMIGLTESGRQYEQRGYTPLMMTASQRRFARWGMPFGHALKDRVAGTSRACRAVVAVRLRWPGREWAALRALQVMQFCSDGLLDEDGDLLEALRAVPGIDPAAAVDAIDSDAVVEAYERDRAEARTAAGTPAEAQGKTASTDGPVRFTAPSLIFEDRAGARLVAGGFQHVDAYDALLANLAPTLERRPAPEHPAAVLRAFPDGLATAEVARIMAAGTGEKPDRDATELALLEAGALRVAAGDDALWLPAAAPGLERSSDGRYRAGMRQPGALASSSRASA